jgi:hypothetical protein
MGLTDPATIHERYGRRLLVNSADPCHYYSLTCRTYDGTAPSHFFGELTKTAEGCEYLREQDVLGSLASIVRQHGLEGRDQSILTSLKCALWALVGLTGNDGSSLG